MLNLVVDLSQRRLLGSLLFEPIFLVKVMCWRAREKFSKNRGLKWRFLAYLFLKI